MRKEKRIGIIVILLVAIFSILIIQTVSAIRVTLDTPQVSFTNQSVGDVVDYRIEVKNNNNYPVTIKITPPEDLQIIFEGETTFILIPNEGKNIPYKITLTEMGDYTKQIRVEYSGNEESFAVYQQLLFNVEKRDYIQFFLWGIGILVVLVIIIVIVKLSNKK